MKVKALEIQLPLIINDARNVLTNINLNPIDTIECSQILHSFKVRDRYRERGIVVCNIIR